MSNGAVANSGLRTAARIASIVGAVGSVGLTLFAGRHNNSVLLMVLFAIWVLSPFATLLAMGRMAQRWPDAMHRVLHILTMAIAAGCLAIFGFVALGPARSHTAFAFVVTPAVCELLLTVLMAVTLSRR